jgi:hypothetical protein
MTETMDLTLLGGQIAELQRSMQLTRMAFDAFMLITPPRLTAIGGRIAGIEGRITALEQGFHDLTQALTTGFGHMQQQQQTRNEQRFNAFDAGLREILETLRR